MDDGGASGIELIAVALPIIAGLIALGKAIVEVVAASRSGASGERSPTGPTILRVRTGPHPESVLTGQKWNQRKAKYIIVLIVSVAAFFVYLRAALDADNEGRTLLLVVLTVGLVEFLLLAVETGAALWRTHGKKPGDRFSLSWALVTFAGNRDTVIRSVKHALVDMRAIQAYETCMTIDEIQARFQGHPGRGARLGICVSTRSSGQHVVLIEAWQPFPSILLRRPDRYVRMALRTLLE